MENIKSDNERIRDNCIELIILSCPADLSLIKEKDECIAWLENINF